MSRRLVEGPHCPRHSQARGGTRDGAGHSLVDTMNSLSERLTRGSASAPEQVDHARRLVADWQLLADLSFADLTLWVPLQ